MKILVSGSSGLIGSALIPVLTAQGHSVVRLVRRVPKGGAEEVQWDPAGGTIDADALEGMDAVVHLAGENLAARRWTAAQKARIADSRIKGTGLLANAIAERSAPPKVLAASSAIGYYGDRGSELLTEDSPPGSGFLADLARDWEAATQPAANAGIRVVKLRTGIALSPEGGALAKMLLPFRLGLGATLGSGSQYLSWIALDDVVAAYVHVLTTESLSGPVNAVAPIPVTNREFTKTLGRVLGRPAVFTAPAFMLRAAVGEMAQEALLGGARVEPKRLAASGFRFEYPELEGALRHVLKEE